ncbi:MAG TPA: thiamine biosynthesis protein ApbE, partial [Pseudomonas sp.]|nr:thiamine biosynthesis protein ApbE [Pseudomonas sp.]
MAVASLRPVIAVALATALTGCLFQDKVEAFTGPTMGSTYTIKYVRSGDVPAKEVLHGEVEAIL